MGRAGSSLAREMACMRKKPSTTSLFSFHLHSSTEAHLYRALAAPNVSTALAKQPQVDRRERRA